MLSEEFIDVALRLLAAVGAGMAIGLNRDIKGKPTGMRTRGLVSLGAALVSIVMVHHADMQQHPDALSRVLQGIIQGVMTGIGFIGAGVILRDHKEKEVEGLTTAACVWVTAALGIACALAAWNIVLLGAGLALAILTLGRPVERVLSSLFAPGSKERSGDS
jgi:putative Mg2+ transporter-C (MgtC) family protein